MLFNGDSSLVGIKSSLLNFPGEFLKGLEGKISVLLEGEKVAGFPGETLEFLSGIELTKEDSR
jgi:hypothetical protein